jgi:hypothetical protein
VQIGILESFEVRADDGSLADVPGARRVQLLREALALWRGAAMADVG